jgi:hypothetical protein
MSEQVYPYTVKYNRNTGAGKMGYWEIKLI